MCIYALLSIRNIYKDRYVLRIIFAFQSKNLQIKYTMKLYIYKKV
jgi:hypothetical protein